MESDNEKPPPTVLESTGTEESEAKEDTESGGVSSRRRKIFDAFKKAEDRINESTSPTKTTPDRDANSTKRGPEIRSMIREFADTSEVLMNVLDEVQKLHPCIGVVVIAFKTMISLELKRRENDDKVMALLVKIQDMMKVLVQLRAISPDQKGHKEPFTVQEKIASLCVDIEADIKACGNLCDAWSKKGIFAKLIKSPLYEIRLAEFGDTFGERQKELELALSIFIAQEVRTANENLSQMKESLESTHEKLDMLLVFRSLQSPVERDLWEFIRAKGGLAKVMEDDTMTARVIQLLDRKDNSLGQGQGSNWNFGSRNSGLRTPHWSNVQLPSTSSSSPWNTSTPLYSSSRHMSPMDYIPTIPGASPMHVPPASFPRSPSAQNWMYQSPMRQASSMPTMPTQSPAHSPWYNTAPFPNSVRTPMGASSTLGPSPFTAPNFLPTPESHSQPETSTPVGVPGSLPTGPTPHAPSRRNSQNVGYMPVTSEATRAQIKWLRKELDEDVDEEVKINLVVYLRKFDAQQRQLLAQIELAIVKQGDRVVEAVTGGPHDRIHDKELRQVWKDMGWRLLVPTTEFVLTLHDYFVSQHRDMYIFDAHLSRPPRLGSTTADVNKALSDAIAAAKKRTEDKWALKSLTVTNLQPIWEVFDADASGYVSVWEANQVCSLRPDDWSLLQWLAYWASGRHFAIWQYSQKISGILQDMHQLLRTRVLPLNRYAIDRYLHRMKTLNRVLSSTFPCDDPPQGELNQRVSTYTQKEEERMDRILSCLDYDIDGPDTIELITSRYHIERDFFPLIYLLLRRHLSLVRLACDVVFDGEEMNTPAQSLRNVFKAVKARVTLLETLFLQRGLNPLAQLSNFAFGMYHFVYQRYDPIFPLIEDKNDDVIAKISSAPVTRLKAGVHEVEAEPVFEGDADPIEFESCIGNGINGCWTGYFMDAEGADVLGLVRFRVSNWIEAVGAFDGTGMYGKGTLTVEGSYDLNDKILEAKFRTKGAPQLGDVGEEINIVVVGTLKAIVAGEPGSALQTQHTIHARWGHSEDSLNGRLYFSQTPAWVHLLRVSLGNQYPTEAHYKPAGWRWRFAIHAVRYRVRSQRGMLDPDGHCFIRLKLIRRAVALFKQQQLVGPLSIRATEETENIQRALPPTLVNTCLWLARSSPWPTVHFNETCTRCSETIFGHRFLYISRQVLTSETFCSICQKPGGPNGWWTCKLEEIRIKASQLVHRRDLNEFVNDAIAAERTAYQRYRSRPVDVSSFPLPSGFHPYSFTPFSPLSPISENSEEGEFTSTGFSSSPTEEKNMFPSHSPVSPSPASTPSSLALPDGRRRRVRFSTDDTTQTFSSRSSTPELLNSGVLLSCACCGAGLPNENGDAIWVCLVCSIVKTEELVGICTRCELLNRKGIAPHLAHRHDHTLVQIRPWHSPVGIDDYTAATPDGFTPRTPGTPYPSYPGRLPDAEYDKGPNYRTWSGLSDSPPLSPM